MMLTHRWIAVLGTPNEHLAVEGDELKNPMYATKVGCSANESIETESVQTWFTAKLLNETVECPKKQ